jgi:uncharacterized protein (TIGR02145 family)
MNIYYTNGSVLSIPITTIDSINYTLDSNVCPSTVVDVEGNIYNTVLIGAQCWMKENLKTTHYKNGTPIQTGLSDTAWIITTTGAYADYNNDISNSVVYGRLYNWYAVADSAGLCPAGWHVPEEGEWNILVKSIDANADTICNVCYQSQIAGGAMKEIGITHWASPNTGASNSSSFTILPSGHRNNVGAYLSIGYYGFLWSATSYSATLAYYRLFDYQSNAEFRNYAVNRNGNSVRCVRD